MAGKGGKGGGLNAPGVEPIVSAVNKKKDRLYNYIPQADFAAPDVDNNNVENLQTLSKTNVADVLENENINKADSELRAPEPVSPINMDANEFEQWDRERVAALTERMGTADLSPANFAVDSPINAALQRAEQVGYVISDRLAASLTDYKQGKVIEEGFDEATISTAAPDKFVPAKRGGITGVNLTSLLFDPEIMDGGIERDGVIIPDPELGKVMAITVESHLYNTLISSNSDSDVTDDSLEAVPNDTGIENLETIAYRPKEISKSKGNALLGKEVYESWKRQQALMQGIPTDNYVSDAGKITQETFTLLGDLSKELYSTANSEMLYRDASKTGINKGQVDFILTPKGVSNLNILNDSFKALFSRPEVPPQNTPTGQLAYEGQRRTRKWTTVMDKDLGDTSLIEQSTANYNSIALVSDPNREALSLMFAMQALGNFDGETDSGSNYYADMFEVGIKRERKADRQREAYMKERDQYMLAPEENKDKILALEAILDKYDPKQIVRQEQEKMFTLIDSIARYGGKANYITYAVQALTGRTHVQQTLYNPQSHKIIRSVVGSGNVFAFKPRSDSKLETSWKEVIATRILTDPIVEADPNAKGIDKLSTKQRLRIFEEQRKNKSSSYWQAVGYGEALLAAKNNFNVTQAKDNIQRLANAKDVNETKAIKEEIFSSDLYAADPLSQFPDLKKILAGHDKEAPLFADYYMDLAKYEKAVANKSQFSTSISVEIDGRTHGPATNAALIGVYEMAQRAGLLRDQDYYATDLPDLRDAMGVDMLTRLGEFQGTLYKEEQHGVYEQLLKLAIADRNVFLKKSPMTMGYGQEIESLKQHVKEVIDTGKSSELIQQLMEQNNISKEEAVLFLHTMLVDSIFNVLSSSVIAAGKVMKANALFAQMTDIPLVFTNAMGFKSYAAGRESFLDKSYGYDIRPEDPNSKVQRITTQFYGSRVSGSAIRGDIGPGGYGGRIQAIGVQSYDGNMIARTGTGASWKKINEIAKQNGSKNGAFMLPIFDAFVTDLGSYETVREEANKNWAESIKNHSYITSVTDEWYSEANKDYEAKMTGVNANVKIDWEKAKKGEGENKGLAYLFTTVVKKNGEMGKDIYLTDAIRRTQKAPPMGKDFKVINDKTVLVKFTRPETTDAYIKRLGDKAYMIKNTILKDIAKAGIPNPLYSKILTNRQIYDITNIIKKHIELSNRNAGLSRITKNNVAKIFKEVDRQKFTPRNVG